MGVHVENIETKRQNTGRRHKNMQLSQISGLLDRRQLAENPVSESFNDWFSNLMAGVRVDKVLAVHAELAQLLVRGAAPLSQHELVVNSVRLVKWRQISVMLLQRLHIHLKPLTTIIITIIIIIVTYYGTN